MKRLFLAGFLTLALAAPAYVQVAQTREQKVRGDKAKIEADSYWKYNDLPGAIIEARRTGKPLLVTFRCIPCEACAQLDQEVVDRNVAIRALLDKFVCVRIVHANGMDLSLFQFDYDQSWTAFMMNADRTLYGRYGTRSHRTESHNDMSIQGFARALEAALTLHAGYPANKAQLAGKQSQPGPYRTPEEMPMFQGKFKDRLDYQGNVVASCIHCHQVGEAIRVEARKAGPIPDPVLYPYPNPSLVGLVMDPAERAKVRAVTPDSPASAAGFRVGDVIESLEGQPILSTADLQWVFHRAPDAARLNAKVRRGSGPFLTLTLNLNSGWRRKDDFTWRATTWDLRKMGFGGMFLEDVPDSERAALGLETNSLALRAKHVGQYGEHAAAKRAGFQARDIVVAVEGKTDRMTEAQLLASILNSRRPGAKVPVTVRRGNQTLQMEIPVQ